MLVAVALGGGVGGEGAAGQARLEVDRDQATVGDPLAATLTLDLASGVVFVPASLGSEIGPFSVEGGSWSVPPEGEPPRRWVWTGRLFAFRTGVLKVPPIALRVEGESGSFSISTAPVEVTIDSVLTEQDLAAEAPELADLKPPASMAPRYGPLWAVLGGLVLLLASAGLLWWLHRRYAAKFSAVPAPEDPFQRTAPHIWVYAELQRLLARRLPEQGQIDPFYAELSRILKIYLGGRFRVDLLEHTTEEVPDRLWQAGTDADAVAEVIALLAECDRVKFAKHRPDPDGCRDAIERIYRVVDTTKPVDGTAAAARRGAA